LTGELRRLAAETTSPAELMRRLNQSLAGQMQDHRFATMVCVLLDVPNQRWVVSNAGHVLPILRRGSGWVSLIAQPSGSPIGISPTASYQETVYPALPRDIVILTTDGALDVLSERRGDGSVGDSSRLIRMIETGPHDVGDLGRKIIAAVEATTGERDDVALLGLQLPG
jgi:serine phosphatase RsbU (regulator of sigma subunit)